MAKRRSPAQRAASARNLVKARAARSRAGGDTQQSLRQHAHTALTKQIAKASSTPTRIGAGHYRVGTVDIRNEFQNKGGIGTTKLPRGKYRMFNTFTGEQVGNRPVSLKQAQRHLSGTKIKSTPEKLSYDTSSSAGRGPIPMSTRGIARPVSSNVGGGIAHEPVVKKAVQGTKAKSNLAPSPERLSYNTSSSAGRGRIRMKQK